MKKIDVSRWHVNCVKSENGASQVIKIVKTNSTAELHDMCIKFDQEIRDMDKVSQVWLAYENNDVVGCVAVKLINQKFDLAWLIVEDGYEDVFLKQELYGLALDYAIANGAKKLYINKKDWDFYEKRGFREITDDEMPAEFRYCVPCEKRNVSCFPKSMVLKLKQNTDQLKKNRRQIMIEKDSIPIKIVDVFTTKPFEGNPAGVVLDSSGLTKNQMQKIAREINLSNTTFVSSPKKNGDVNVRFFTPKKEIDMCGHSTIATFFAWGEENLTHDEDCSSIVRMETNVGVLPVYIEITDGKIDFVTVTLPNPKFSRVPITEDRLVKALNLSKNSIIPKLPIEIVYDGLFFLEIGVKDRETLLKVDPRFNDLLKISSELKIDSIQVFTLDTIHPDSTVHSRTFFPILGVNEDPVCGTGNAALASYLIKNRLIEITKPTTRIVGEQGYSLLRPGIVTILVDLIHDKIERLRVRGKAVSVLSGNILIRR